MTPAIASGIALIRGALVSRRFRVCSEADLQDHVAKVLACPGLEVQREVIAANGRYDLQVRYSHVAVTPSGVETSPPVIIVLELKLRCAPAAVERQAQRYAMTHGVDAVCVVTMSPQLAHRLADLSELGGKPFAVIGLRSW